MPPLRVGNIALVPTSKMPQPQAQACPTPGAAAATTHSAPARAPHLDLLFIEVTPLQKFADARGRPRTAGASRIVRDAPPGLKTQDQAGSGGPREDCARRIVAGKSCSAAETPRSAEPPAFSAGARTGGAEGPRDPRG